MFFNQMFWLESYTIIAYFIPKSLCFMYITGTAPFLFQIRGLIETHGILPVTKYLNFLSRRFPNRYFYDAPALFWFNSSNEALVSLVIAGIITLSSTLQRFKLA